MTESDRILRRYSTITLICVSIIVLCGIIVFSRISEQAKNFEATQQELIKLDQLLVDRTKMFKIIENNQMKILENHDLILQAIKNQNKILKSK